MRSAITLIFFTLVFSNALLAEEPVLDQASQEALEQTKALLSNPVQRNIAVQENENTRKADESVKRLGLSQEANEAIYKVSGEILEKMVKDSNGDPAAMTEAVQKMMKDPESLEKILSPEQREKIRKLASESEDSKNPPPSSQ